MPNASVRRLARIRRLRGRGRFGLGFIAVELAHDIGANRPQRDLRRLGFLALAVRLLVSRAYKAAFDEDVRTLLDCGEDVLGEPGAEDRDAMPLGLRGPFVLGVFPGASRGDGEHGELRTVAFRLTLLWVRADEPNESY